MMNAVLSLMIYAMVGPMGSGKNSHCQKTRAERGTAAQIRPKYVDLSFRSSARMSDFHPGQKEKRSEAGGRLSFPHDERRSYG